MKLEDLTFTQIKQVIRKYNKALKIAGYSKLKKEEVIALLKAHPKLKISENDKGVSFKILNFEAEVDEKKKAEPKQAPEPKEAPEPKKFKFKIKPKQEPEPKEETDLTYDDVVNIYEKNKLDKPVPFVCQSKTQALMLLSVVMNRHKNDCLGVITRKNKKIPISFRFKFGRKFQFVNAFKERIEYNTTEELSELSETILEKYLNCKKNNKSLVIPLFLRSKKGGHANILIMNHKNNTLEHFEPHGEIAKHLTENQNKKIDTELKRLVDTINLKNKDIEIKYVPRKLTCPTGFKSFQSLENEDVKTGEMFKVKEFGNYSVEVKKDNGYCCAWSYLYLDFRLTNLSETDVNKFSKELRANLPEKLKKYVRGLTNEMLVLWIKLLKEIQKENNISDEEIENHFTMDIIGRVNKTPNFNLIEKKLKEKSTNSFLKSIQY